MKQGFAMPALNLTTASQEAVIEELGTADKPVVYGHKQMFEGVRFGITLPQILSISTHMNALRNRVLLIGRLGQDPERIEFDGGKVKAIIRLATNEVYRNADGDKMETTQWHNIVAWGRLADIMTKYLCKGNEVAIEGRLVYRQYEDKMGQQRVAAEIVTQEMLMLDRPLQDT